ncbi:MAG: ABC transporter ATP-binding protein [Actinobacteria bacterium]|nr:ABC transporter ATP-binding protein [Actinomycetota bacterium]
MPPVIPPALHCVGVTKTFRNEVVALDGIDLTVPMGALIGLLGPNGAGKTTLIRSVVGLNAPDGGRLEVLGISVTGPDAPAARRLVGYAPQEVALDRFVRVRDLLTFHGRYFGMRRADAAARADELLDAFDLSGKARSLPSTLSGGMRRRLMLARALVHRPALVILDEPTAGVDVELRDELWVYIRRLNEDGTTILLTTHHIEEAEGLCDSVAFILAGRIVDDGTPAALRDRFGAARLEDVYRQIVAR